MVILPVMEPALLAPALSAGPSFFYPPIGIMNPVAARQRSGDPTGPDHRVGTGDRCLIIYATMERVELSPSLRETETGGGVGISPEHALYHEYGNRAT